MANELSRVKDGGAWKTATAIHVKDAGVWKPVKSIWVHDAGIWKKVYFKSFRFNHTYNTDTASPSLSALATALGWNGTDPVVGNVVVNANLYSNHVSSAALYCYGLPTGSLINLTINAGKTIGGRGGDGGLGGGGAGGSGGTGIYARNAMAITNNGIVAGGGGGGGGGGDVFDPNVGGSGGGGGRGGASGGSGKFGSYAYGNNGNASSFGGWASGGDRVYARTDQVDGEGNIVLTQEAYSGAGGNGGDWGQPGATGNHAENIQNASLSSFPGAGGAAGWAVDGNSFVTWAAAGSRLGHLGN